jgi:hypothetical protein
MRSFGLFLILFWLLVLLLLASVINNFMQATSLLGTQEFVLIGFLVFLVIGDEFVKVRLSKSGLEVHQENERTK